MCRRRSQRCMITATAIELLLLLDDEELDDDDDELEDDLGESTALCRYVSRCVENAFACFPSCFHCFHLLYTSSPGAWAGGDHPYRGVGGRGCRDFEDWTCVADWNTRRLIHILPKTRTFNTVGCADRRRRTPAPRDLALTTGTRKDGGSFAASFHRPGCHGGHHDRGREDECWREVCVFEVEGNSPSQCGSVGV